MCKQHQQSWPHRAETADFTVQNGLLRQNTASIQMHLLAAHCLAQVRPEWLFPEWPFCRPVLQTGVFIRACSCRPVFKPASLSVLVLVGRFYKPASLSVLVLVGRFSNRRPYLCLFLSAGFQTGAFISPERSSGLHSTCRAVLAVNFFFDRINMIYKIV
jgi:hypothetical protein